MLNLIKSWIKRAAFRAGYQVGAAPRIPATPGRPVGNLATTLEDIRHRGFHPKTIFDVGANSGEWTQIANTVFSNANFYMFEPQPECREQLEKIANAIPRARIVSTALGATVSTGTFQKNPESHFTGSSFFFEDAAPVQNRVEIPITTIDTLIASREIPVPDLVKLDVQGYELEVLKGARSIIGLTELLLLEMSLMPLSTEAPLFHDVIRYLADRRYYAYDLPGFHRRPYDGALVQTDVLFAHESSKLFENRGWSRFVSRQSPLNHYGNSNPAGH